MDKVRLLWLLAFRSLTAHKVKSLFVGSLLFVGTFLVVFGSAMLSSIQTSMEQSITSSVAGHLQVYAADAKDPLQVFGGFDLSSADVGEVPSFAEVEPVLSGVDNVKAVVPMGIVNATVFTRTSIDQALADLRDAANTLDAAKQRDIVPRVRLIVASMEESLETRAAVERDVDKVAKDKAALEKAASETFWQDEFAMDPFGSLDFLDNNIAPLSQDGQIFYLRIIGTDPVQFADVFDRFYIVDGERIPEGKRGFLFSKRTYEQLIKNVVARHLDMVKKNRDAGSTIAGDTITGQLAARCAGQYKRVVFDLGPDDAEHVQGVLAAHLGHDGELTALMQEFLTLDDANFDARYALFYAEIAPRIRLYDPAVGETITLRAFTRTGYLRSVNATIYGTYELKGMEAADLGSAANLADLVTFRDLYGKMTERELAELEDIRADVGVEALDREDAEAALFGGGGDLVADAGLDGLASDFDPDLDVKKVDADASYTRSEVRDGLVLNMAVMLDDASRLRETQTSLEQAIAANGLNLQVIDWQTAAGTVGNFIIVMRLVLVTALFVIFLVALIIINNAMVSATLDRTGEIGTMRAIGAQKPMVVALFLAETLLLGIFAGGAGAGAATAMILWLGQVGVPAGAEIMVLLFAGDRLYPSIGAIDLLFGVVTVVGVAGLSSVYPALVAAGIQPIVAMRGRDG